MPPPTPPSGRQSNNVAIRLIRIVLAEMYQAVKADKQIDLIHLDVWAETIDWSASGWGRTTKRC